LPAPQDDDNLLGKRDLQLASDALSANLRDARPPPGQRGGRGGAPPPNVPNPFTALFKELEVARMQSVDFATFVTLEKRFPAMCTGPNLIWGTLQPYAAPAAALVRRLRLSGHLEFLAAPKHAKPLFVTASLRRLPSSSRASGGADATVSSSSRNASGGGSGGGGGAEQPGPRGKPKLPPLALSALRDEQPQQDRRFGPPAGAARGAAWPPRDGARGGGGADDEDDLDGFAGWAASQRGQRAPGARGGLPLRRAESMPREGSPVMRGRLPPPGQFGTASADPTLLPTYAEFSQQRGGAYGARAPSPTRQQLPPRADMDADVGQLVAALAAPRARSPQKHSARVTDDYYARLNEVAATRHLTRSSTLG
jgi:hypothetical protein